MKVDAYYFFGMYFIILKTAFIIFIAHQFNNIKTENMNFKLIEFYFIMINTH